VINDEYRAEQARRRPNPELQQHLHAFQEEHTAWLQAWHESPSTWLLDSLQTVAAMW
jgi:hypothetical protein